MIEDLYVKEYCSFENLDPYINTTSIFLSEEDFAAEMSIEAFKGLLPSVARMGKIIPLTTNTGEYKKNGLLLKQFSELGIVPMVSSIKEVAHTIKLLFGEANYKKMVMNYIIQKKWKFKNPYVPGSKLIIVNDDIKNYTSEIQGLLPGIINKPSFYIRNNKNTVFDFTKLFSLTLPTKEMLMRPKVFPISDKLILQSISRIAFGNTNTETHPLFTQFHSMFNGVTSVMKNVLITIPVEARDIRIANMWIDPKLKAKVPIMALKDPLIAKTLGPITFITKLMAEYPFTTEFEYELAEKVKQCDHAVFFFHNRTHGFYFDWGEYKERVASGQMTYNSIFKFMKLSLKILLGLNAGFIDQNDIVTDETVLDDEKQAHYEKLLDNKIDNETVEEEKIEPVSPQQKVTALEKITKPEKKEADIEKREPEKPIVATVLKTKTKEKKIVDEIKAMVGIKPQDQKEVFKKALATSVNQNLIAKTQSKKAEMKSYNDDETTSDYEEEETSELETDEAREERLREEEKLKELDKMIDAGENETDDFDLENDETDEFLKQFKEEKVKKETEKLIANIREKELKKLSKKEQERLEYLENKYKSVKLDENTTIEDVINTKEATTIDVDKTNYKIRDTSYNYSTLQDMSKSYLKKTFNKDMVDVVRHFSKDKRLNMYITDFSKKDISDELNQVEQYEFKLEDVGNKRHVIRFNYPKIDENGFMFINGNKKNLKKQLVLNPVTKTSPDEVYLRSTYNKTRVYRQGVALNRNTIILKKLLQEIRKRLDMPQKTQTGVPFSKKIIIDIGKNTKINEDYDTTIEYDELAEYIHKIILNPSKEKIVFYFNQKEIRDDITLYKLKYNDTITETPIAIDFSKNKVISVKNHDSNESVALIIINAIRDAGIMDDFDTFMANVSVPKTKMLSRIELLSKPVALIVFLSSLYGFKKVLEVAKVQYTFVPRGEKPSIDVSNKLVIQFRNGKFYYDQYPIENTLLVNGLNELQTLQLDFEDLEELGTYLDYVYDLYKTRNLYKGWTAFFELFIDPITKDVLQKLHLPTDFLELFLYANSLLSSNKHVLNSESVSWRIRDYEIVNALLYEVIAKEYQVYTQKGKQKEGFKIPENDIIRELSTSPLLENYDTTNPVNELRSRSAITYKGPTGINLDRAFTLDKRGISRSFVGTVGMSSIDNASVGITKQLTLCPRLDTTRGFIVPPKSDKDVMDIPSASLLTPEESLLPYINKDDPKRVGFASGQSKHVVPANDFTLPVLGTGFEQTIINKTSDDFGFKAKQDGVVKLVDETNKMIILAYKDGSFERVPYGDMYNRNSDFFLSNNLDCNVKKGQPIKRGDVITYNRDFYKKHLGKLFFTQGVICKIAVLDGELTEAEAEEQKLVNEHYSHEKGPRLSSIWHASEMFLMLNNRE